MARCNDIRIPVYHKEWCLWCSTKTKIEFSRLLEVDIQDKALNIWRYWEIQVNIHSSRILIERRNWLWRDFCTSSKVYLNQNCPFLDNQDEMEATPNRCKYGILKWCNRIRSIHWTTSRFWNTRQKFTCMHIEESIIWIKESTQSVVWKNWWIPNELGIYQE